MHRVFVYGTLLRHEPNHRLLLGARFVRAARTLPRFELVDLGDYPALVEGGGTAVHGEVYEVDDGCLAGLDALEEVPLLYERREIELSSGDRAQAYLMPRAAARGRPRIASGSWRRFRKGSGE